MTITEALQEIKTLGARIEKKRVALQKYIVRDSRVRDPFEATGGSEKYVREERQSIADLESRIIEIRTNIQRANLSATLKIGSKERTVAEWLTWRREVSKGQKDFASSILGGIQSMRVQAQQKGGKLIGPGSVQQNVTLGQEAPPEIVVNLNEQALLEEVEEMEVILGNLDGKLSLFNATTHIN